MALTTTISTQFLALLTGTGTSLVQPQAPHAKSFGANWASGVLAGQADLVWSSTNTLTASSNVDLDLAGILTAPLGGTLTFARLKAILVSADAGNTNNVVVGGAASAQFVGPFGAAAHTVAVQPGGMYCVVAPGATAWPVTATTADLLRIANGGAGTPVTYDIMIIGASA